MKSRSLKWDKQRPLSKSVMYVLGKDEDGL